MVNIAITGINDSISLAWHFMWLALLWLSFQCSVKILSKQLNIHCVCFALYVCCPSFISCYLASSL